jgi:hypothetical protein
MCDATSRKKKECRASPEQGETNAKKGDKEGSLNKRTGDKRKGKKETKIPQAKLDCSLK